MESGLGQSRSPVGSREQQLDLLNVMPQPANLPPQEIEKEAARFAAENNHRWKQTKISALARSLKARIEMLPVGSDDTVAQESVVIIPPDQSIPLTEFRSSAKDLGFLIRLEPFASLPRSNLAIAHEIGHFVLHSKMGRRPLISGRGSDSLPAESEASRFGRALLMPEAAVREAINDPELSDLSYLGIYFGVPAATIKQRLDELGLQMPAKQK